MDIAELKDLLGLMLTALGIVGALIGFWKFRGEILRSRGERARAARDELRRPEVEKWSIEAIDTMRRIAMATQEAAAGREEAAAGLTDLGSRASVLLEVGRLYFRNPGADSVNLHKEPAYRGYRPMILEQLLIGYELSRAWASADAAEQGDFARVAETAWRRFVSLAQAEVGRLGTLDPETARIGTGRALDRALAELREAVRPASPPS
jgi:hypothetical protein